MVSISTHRLRLRDFNREDWTSVHEYASDPEVVRHMEWGPNSEEDTRNFIERTLARQQEEPRRFLDFAIALKTDGKIVGGCSINVSSPESREGWIGYVLHRQFWGKGYATEASTALLDFGFNKLGLHRIYATCDVENAASSRVMEKIGMKREARLRENKWQKGKWRDTYIYAILDCEWEQRKEL